MHIYDKQCGIMQKNQWKSSNFQIQCFYKGTAGALCWKRKKLQKLGKLKRLFLKFFKYYDPPRVAPCSPCSWAHWECAGLGKESVFKSRDHWAFLFDRTFHRRSQRSQTLLCSEITRTDALRFWMHMWLFMYWAGPKHCPHLLQQFIHLKGSNMTNDVNFVTNILCLKQLWRTTSLVTLQRSLH